MKSQHFLGSLAGDHEVVFQLNPLQASRSHLRVVRSCVIDEQATHDIRGHSNKVLTALPIDSIPRKT
jgi:hypothetical protein